MPSNVEKLRILLNDIAALREQQPKPADSSAPAPMTFHSRTIGEEAFPKGRFSQELASDVIGTGAPKYPAAGVSWPEFLNGPDELGYEIDALEEPAGTAQEVEQAQQILEEREMRAVTSSGAHDPDVVAAPEAVGSPSPNASVERALGSPSRFRRRI